MDFRTQLPTFESPFQLTYQDDALALGSCFAEHIGQRLIDYKFNLQLNPFGILYNPLSLLEALQFLASDDDIRSGDLFLHQDLWHHFSFHSRFSHPDQAKALEQMQQSVALTRKHWPNIKRILLTFGTAFIFRERAGGRYVANCHKLPGSSFERIRLQAEDFLPGYIELLQHWKAAQPELEVLISVSPVRHIRDGLIQNQRSKATLLLAAEKLTEALDFVHYFPAYELVLDDLRDYRFFAKDLIHPNEQAVDYVWEFFRASCFQEATQQLYQEVQAIVQASRHRPFHTNTEAHRTFCERQLGKIAELERRYEWLAFERERIHFDGVF